ncbi:hypothetical protein KGA66_19045 [Actinocrinis puniceicyclus]|uniref:Uncharacterized protein n=1 Tax=Actinocrinis puniceicyclus TaxID=977794 RepID=A0A8J8BE46_9ACTN|nr:hypothetical protein [Actinocrinis puniceicyclus]MBS2965155.1 hypothetical protein [Actinocrinis puniceicyclus]
MLDETRPYLTDENRLYLEQYLYQSGFHSVLCTEGAGDAVHLGLALFDEQERAFNAWDIAVLLRLGRILTRQAELLTRLPQKPGWAAGLAAAMAALGAQLSRPPESRSIWCRKTLRARFPVRCAVVDESAFHDGVGHVGHPG